MDKQKTILHLCSYTWEVGGPSSVILNQAKFQQAYAIKNVVISTINPRMQAYPQHGLVRVFYFPKSRISSILPDFSWKLLFWYFKNYKSFDVVQIHGLWNFGSILPFLFPKKNKIVVTIHGFLDPYVLKESKWKKRIFWNIFHRWQLKKADVIHVMSQDENTIVGQLFPFQKNIIKYVPNGYDVPLNKFEVEPNFKKELDDFISNSDCTFLFLGRLHSKKGLGILIEAYKSLIKKELGSVKLIIAGPDDGYLQELIQETSGLSSGTYLQFPAITGDNKDYLIRSSDVFVLPSYSEGFSIAALEAIAYAKACIFSHHIGFSDILISNNAALICDTNAESLVGQMEKLVLNANLRSNLGKNALKVHSNNFTNEIVGKQFLDSVFK